MDRSSLLLLSALLLGACATVEPGREEARAIASEQIQDQPDAWTAAAARVGEVEAGWSEAFADETLNALVAEAQSNNRDLRAAALSVERAWLLADQSGAALSPQVNATLGGNSQGNFDGQNSDSVSVGAQASWELDVWGRVRSGQQAAIKISSKRLQKRIASFRCRSTMALPQRKTSRWRKPIWQAQATRWKARQQGGTLPFGHLRCSLAGILLRTCLLGLNCQLSRAIRQRDCHPVCSKDGLT